MAVGNHVVGDSRVEKAAMTARDLGYRVTVVGVAHRSVYPVSFIDGNIPVVRIALGTANHSAIADTVKEEIVALRESDKLLAAQAREVEMYDSLLSRSESGVGMPRFFRSTRLECRVTPPTRRKGKI
ncbi:hypothetical protein C1Y63_12190, partial [Corynebacterium sp. 13CS0277]